MATAETQLTPTAIWWLERRKKTMEFNRANNGRVGITEFLERVNDMWKTRYIVRHRCYNGQRSKVTTNLAAAVAWYNQMESRLIPAKFQVLNEVQS